MNYRPVIALLLASFFIACSPKEEVVRTEKLPNKGVKFLQAKVADNQLEYETISAKFSAHTNFDGEKLNFKGSMRIKKDSIIWLSMTKLGGVEVVRLILTEDSIKFLNKWDKEYYLGSIDKLDQLQDVEIGFRDFQNLLTGQMIDYNEDGKFTSSNDNVSYILGSKNKGKVKRASTIIEGDSTLNIEVQEDLLQKTLDKKPDVDYVIKNYYLQPETFWLTRQTINLVDQQQAMDVMYNDYQLINDEIPMAMEQFIRIAAPKRQGGIELEFSSWNFNVNISYPFKISSKYAPLKKRN